MQKGFIEMTTLSFIVLTICLVYVFTTVGLLYANRFTPNKFSKCCAYTTFVLVVLFVILSISLT